MSKRTRNDHGWTRPTDDGRKREVRARFGRSVWKLISRYSDEPEWTEHDEPLLEDLEELYQLVFNKYQRNRVAWELVLSVRRAIEARGGAIPE